jgi:hypothetical protein
MRLFGSFFANEFSGVIISPSRYHRYSSSVSNSNRGFPLCGIQKLNHVGTRNYGHHRLTRRQSELESGRYRALSGSPKFNFNNTFKTFAGIDSNTGINRINAITKFLGVETGIHQTRTMASSSEVSYLNQADAIAVDEELFSSGGFSVRTLSFDLLIGYSLPIEFLPIFKVKVTFSL